MTGPAVVGVIPSRPSLYHNRAELLTSLKMNANETIYSASVPNVCQKYINGAVRLPILTQFPKPPLTPTDQPSHRTLLLLFPLLYHLRPQSNLRDVLRRRETRDLRR